MPLPAAPLALIVTMALGGLATGAHAEDGGARPVSPAAQDVFQQRTGVMTIVMRIGDRTVAATLDDNPTSRDFVSLLPLTLTLDDYAATEKVSYLPRKLTRDASPAGVDPSIGDIAYYAPWGNLAIFFKDFGYSTGLIKLGAIRSGLELLTTPGPVRVTIERDAGS